MRSRTLLGVSTAWLVVCGMLSAACSSDDPAKTPPSNSTPDAAAASDSSGGGDGPALELPCDPYAERTTPVETIIAPTGLEGALLLIINQAKTTLEILAGEVSHKPIAQALAQAKDRGVAVRVVVDRAFAKDLKSALGEALHESPASLPGSNAKVIIADGAKVVVGSFDFTERAMTKERNYGVVLTEPDDIAVVRSIFEQDWKGEGGPARLCNRVIASPGSARQLITDHIDSAAERLDIEVDAITDARVLEAIKGRAGNGFSVRVLLAGPEVVKGTDATGDALKAAGVDVRYFRNPDVAAKLVLTERGALVGSHRLATDALDDHREVSVIVTAADAAGKLATQFEADWSKAALR